MGNSHSDEEKERRENEARRRQEDRDKERDHQEQIAAASQEKRRLELNHAMQMEECRERARQKELQAITKLVQEQQDREKYLRAQEDERRREEASQQAKEREQQQKVLKQVGATIVAAAALLCGTLMWREKKTEDKAWDLVAVERANAEKRAMDAKMQAERDKMAAEIREKELIMLMIAGGTLLIVVTVLVAVYCWSRRGLTVPANRMALPSNVTPGMVAVLPKRGKVGRGAQRKVAGRLTQGGQRPWR